ncbi:hypothetical protein SUNI508_08437 [Seiridium unicorne]|uniref:Uncharacterized protein n=1 Tax=Seiridium unicorne TaxID=138068 RepID=A0ABR2UTM0_9PEZI
MSTPKKIVVVTGANKGIGYETVKALLESSGHYHVFLASRALERGQEAVSQLQKEVAGSNTVEALQLDVTDDSSIEHAFAAVQASVDHVDILINNAGITKDFDYVRGKASLRECFIGSYQVNVAGTHVTTFTFLPLLLKSSDPRLIFVTGLGTFENCAAGKFPLPPDLNVGWPKEMPFETVGYRCSKTALNMLMLDYHWKLQKDGVKVWAVNPGFLATDLGDVKEMVIARGGDHPSVGAALIKSIAEGERDGDVGKYVVKEGIQGF